MKLLVHIPCWTNYNEALLQVERLLNQHLRIRQVQPEFELELSVSVNAVPNIESDIETRFRESTSTFSYVETNISDVNINVGFLEALRRKCDFVWIVSPEDIVSEHALDTIYNRLTSDTKMDFLVADEVNTELRSASLTISNFDFQALGEASFGMVTGVVYRVSSFKNVLHYGLQASFTGWGQLAVILGGARSSNGIRGMVIPSDLLYLRGDPKELTSEQFKDNISKYAHSFFGFLVLISIFSTNPKRDIRKWIYKNFTKIGSYSKLHSSRDNNYVQLVNTKRLAINLVKETSYFNRIVFLISSQMPLYRLRRETITSL